MERSIDIAALALAAAFGAYGAGQCERTPGLVNHPGERVYINASALAGQGNARASTVNPGDVLATADSRVELLLVPGTFLWLGRNTQLQVVSLESKDTRLKLMRGKLLLETTQVNPKRSSIAVGSAIIRPLQAGMYEMTASPCQVKIYEGRVAIRPSLELTKSSAVTCDSPSPRVSGFDTGSADGLYVWSAHMTEYDAAATYGVVIGSKQNPRAAAWCWNSAMNSWAFVPAAGLVSSPFGWVFPAPLQFSRASIFMGPVFGYPAAADPRNLPRKLSAPAPGRVVDLARAPRIGHPDVVRPVNMGPGAPSIIATGPN